MGIQYINARRFKFAVIAGAENVISNHQHLNDINVFPVPDGDTGSNMAATLSSISSGTMNHDAPGLPSLMATIADSAMNGARGNSGAILAQFFQSLAVTFSEHTRITLQHFSDSVGHAAADTRSAIANPVEGTIITVIDDWANWIKKHWHKVENFESLFAHSLVEANRSLMATRDKLEVLKKANVVDAGAQGFVNFIEGVNNHLQSPDSLRLSAKKHSKKTSQAALQPHANSKATLDDEDIKFSAHATHSGEIDYQFCTECLVHGDNLDLTLVREELKAWGDSLVVVGNDHKIKLHIHTNDPDLVFAALRNHGEILATKADDMWAQYRACIGVHASKEIAIITDSSVSLPQEFIAKHNIIIVPLQIIINNKAYLDRVNLPLDKFLSELVIPNNHVTTSQPAPKDYRVAFEKAMRQAKSAIGIFLSSEISGTLRGAQTAKNNFSDLPIEVINSKDIAAGIGLIIETASKYILAGSNIETIRNKVANVISTTKTFTAPKTVRYLIKGGRISKVKGNIATALKLLPIISTHDDGTMDKIATSFGYRLTLRRMLKEAMRHAKTLRNPRFMITHADAELAANNIAECLEKAFQIEKVRIIKASPMVITHCGPGAVSISVAETF